MNDLPRVHEILQATVLRDRPLPPTEMSWEAIFLRGRLVEAAATLLAQGKQIEPDWYERTSDACGEGRYRDKVPHQSCVPYIEGGRRFLAENDFVLEAAQKPVEHPILRYVGHPDWIGHFDSVFFTAVIDLKNGPPPPPDSQLDYAYRYQLALYTLALAEKMGIVSFVYSRIHRIDLHLFDGTYKLVPRADRIDLAEAKHCVEDYYLQQKWRTP